MENKYTIGIDCGGTNIRAGLVNDKTIVDQVLVRESPKNIDEFRSTITGFVKKCSNIPGQKISVGLAVPGSVDYSSNTILKCPSLSYLNGLGARDILDDFTIYFGNDADMSLLGEIASSNLWDRTVGFVTLGTGVGSSYFANQVGPWQSNLSSEMGHIKVIKDGRKCHCGGNGCLEAYFSGWSLMETVKANNLAAQNVEDLFNLARSGTQEILQIISDASHYLGLAIANFINVTGIEKVIISGKISGSLDLIQPILEDELQKNVFNIEGRQISLIKSNLVDQSAIIGSSILAQSGNK